MKAIKIPLKRAAIFYIPNMGKKKKIAAALLINETVNGFHPKKEYLIKIDNAWITSIL